MDRHDLVHVGSETPDGLRNKADAFIDLEDLRKAYEGQHEPVFSGLRHRLSPGVHAIVGESGIGKSTLLHTIAGVLEPDHGIVKIFGETVPREGEEGWIEFLRTHVSLIHQEQNLIEHLDVVGNVSLGMKIVGLNREEVQVSAEQALETVGLSKKRRSRVRDLSGGERQRVAIARTLCSSARAILADEPTGNLDPPNRRSVMEQFRRAAKDHGKSVLLVTHDQELAHELCDSVLELTGEGLRRHQSAPVFDTRT